MHDDARFDRSSRNKLTAHDLDRFTGSTLFDRVARVVSRAECLPRKELYEAWEVARRVRRRFRGGRVVDLACGHALLAHLMLVLDDRSARALAVDLRIPDSAATLASALTNEWPRLSGRVSIERAALESVVLGPEDLVVSVHACGALTDAVLSAAIDARARVAVLPCCHDARTCDTGFVEGWIDAALAIDVTRVARLREADYRVYPQLIPDGITPKNRLLLAEPMASAAQSVRR